MELPTQHTLGCYRHFWPLAVVADPIRAANGCVHILDIEFIESFSFRPPRHMNTKRLDASQSAKDISLPVHP